MSPKSLAELRAFENSEFFASNLIGPFSQRLGFEKNMTLGQIEDIYLACYFGQVLENIQNLVLIPNCI